MNKFTFGTLSIASLSTVLSISTLVAPALSQQRVCDFGVGGVGINCRTEYPADDYRYTDYRNYNRRVSDAQARLIINDFYRQYLGRDADRRGLRDYLNVYRSGRSLEFIRRDIANSQEAQNYRASAGNSDFQVRNLINNYYRQYLGRDAEPAGLQDWLNAYRNGRSLEQIRQDIANSQEAQNYRNRTGYYR